MTHHNLLNALFKVEYPKFFWILILLIWSSQGRSQTMQTQDPKFILGIEQDVLPYFLNGYIFSGWIGKDHWRLRLSTARSDIPNFILDETIERDRVSVASVNIEYSFKQNFKAWWVGPGLSYWLNQVQFKTANELDNVSLVLTAGGGYNYFLKDWLYLSPWVALHSRISGANSVSFGKYIYEPQRFTPELSLKVGIVFPVQ